MTEINTVPEHYLGVWQRKQLESPDGVDNSSRVYWLQTSLFHADIRIPADRPDFKGRKSLRDFSADELKLLASQQGFAGTTSVTGNYCQWSRQMDYQPRRDTPDIGFMQFSGTRILETGVANNYAEIWEQLPDSRGDAFALRFEEDNTSYPIGKPQSGILVVSGDYFIYARERKVSLPPAASLNALLTEAGPDKQQLIELLDFEISFGRVAHGSTPWEILLSTLPFREGDALFTEATWTMISRTKNGCVQHEHAWNGIITRRWLP
jgi:hypothetical protein